MAAPPPAARWWRRLARAKNGAHAFAICIFISTFHIVCVDDTLEGVVDNAAIRRILGTVSDNIVA